MKSILVSWIGFTDISSSKGTNSTGLGPVAQASVDRRYDEIHLISDLSQQTAINYVNWLKVHTSVTINLHNEKLSGPTNFGEIYKAAVTVVTRIQQKHGRNFSLTFHLSPGTPAMAAVWIILAKTRFPAELIESSLEHGVVSVSVPFDISADFIPDLLRRPDRKLEKLAAGLSIEAPEFEDIIYRSDVMKRIILKARRVAPRSIPVLIEGESGTGKELFARAIHKASPRANKAFIAINCGAIPAELMESELFGHEKGSFTGATRDRPGYFEAAEGGTLFLDEIGELPKKMQVKLLRVFQENEIKRIGAITMKKVDIRIIAATNKDIVDEVASSSFREDLFYRLAVAVLKLPPLRDRAGDLSLLIDKLLDQVNQESAIEPGYKDKKISARAKNLMLQHSWRGNVRELLNTLQRAAVWTSGDTIHLEDIKDALLPLSAADNNDEKILNRPISGGINLPDILKNIAAHYLKRALEETHGNKTEASKLLGLSNYQTLSNWLKKYDVN